MVIFHSYVSLPEGNNHPMCWFNILHFIPEKTPIPIVSAFMDGYIDSTKIQLTI